MWGRRTILGQRQDQEAHGAPATSGLLETGLDPARLPRHVAIIMDGNGRWAERRGLPRVAGHRAGIDSLREVVRTASQLGIPVLTVFAFSTENWGRPKGEVDFLMQLLCEAIRREVTELHRHRVRVQVIGRREGLPANVLGEIDWATQLTARNEGLLLNIAFNYGGRAEIADAARRLAADVLAGRIDLNRIDETAFSGYLYTAQLPDPDLLIRTGGEMRLSNFLLWQVAYAELWVTPVCWPDFRGPHLVEAIRAYQQRQRRFGRV